MKMPVATVKFWSFPFGSGSGIAPVFGNTHMPDMTDPDHPVLLETLTKKAVFDDAVTGMIVPRYTGWQKCNAVSFEITGDDPLWYWVRDARRSSDTSESLRYSLSLIAVTSELKIGDTVTGDWSRLPNRTQVLLGQDVPNTSMIRTRKVSLPKIHGPVNTSKYFWVELTATKSFETQWDIGLQKWVVTCTHDRVTKYGCFITDFISVDYTVNPQTTAIYPSLSSLINNPTLLFGGYGTSDTMSSNDIVDISISERCPYAYTEGMHSYTPLMTPNGSAIYPSRAKADGSDIGISMINLSLGSWQEHPDTNITTSITDDELTSGEMYLIDTQGNRIMTLNRNRSMDSINVRTMSEYGRIYTKYTMPDGTVIFDEEGHLPYIGSAWLDYIVNERNYDRQMMQLNIEKQKTDAIQGGIESTLGGMIGGALIGGPVGAVAGAVGSAAGVVGTAITTERNIEYTRDQQKAKENFIRGQSASSYNIGYGINYIQKSMQDIGGFCVSMPDIDSSILTAIASRRGYPADEYSAQAIGEGFHQGTLTNVPEANRRFMDELCAEIAAGVYIKEM